MILVLGSSSDKVYPQLLSHLRETNHVFVVVDEDAPGHYDVYCDSSNGQLVFRIRGNECEGRNPVGAIFVRHAVARTLDSQHLAQMGMLQTKLNHMLLSTSCPTINPPAKAYSNYSKPYQIGLLSEAGFDVPQTLVTNIPDEARRFYEECAGQVIFKGASNVMTLAQVLKSKHFTRLDLLPNSPTLFQEYIAGVDYRVHVVGERVFATRLLATNEDYRRSSLIEDKEIVVEPATLPAQLVQKCIAFTKKLGLIVSGIDFKEDQNGRLVALELNPYPQFTFYEGRSGQPITRAIVDYLVYNQSSNTNIFA